MGYFISKMHSYSNRYFCNIQIPSRIYPLTYLHTYKCTWRYKYINVSACPLEAKMFWQKETILPHFYFPIYSLSSDVISKLQNGIHSQLC